MLGHPSRESGATRGDLDYREKEIVIRDEDCENELRGRQREGWGGFSNRVLIYLCP